jgi:hypothetical protein
MKKFIFPILFIAVVFSACEKEDPVIPNEEELITTLIYELVPDGGGETVILKFQDLDGDGGNNPIFETDPLVANTVYNGTVQVLNELEEPAEDITEEVKEEGEEHQFFFVDDVLKTEVTYDDVDLGGNPIGIETILETGSATTGTLTIILRHEPKKPNDGTPEDAGGETDIEVTFNITVE